MDSYNWFVTLNRFWNKDKDWIIPFCMLTLSLNLKFVISRCCFAEYTKGILKSFSKDNGDSNENVTNLHI